MPGKIKESGGSPASGGRTPISRREFVEAAAIAGAGLATLSFSAESEQGRLSVAVWRTRRTISRRRIAR